MKTAFKIFKRDVKRLVKNPIALIVTLGVCIIPSLYAWFNILANWDPYENTSDVAVAIVNEDQGATLADMGQMNAGDMVVDQLKENTQLGWTFVDKNQALDGVNAGTYYAAIVIPKDFTSTLAGVVDGKTEQAHLGYFVNEKANAIAPKVTDTGASTIEATINQTFVGTVADVISNKVVGLADKTSSQLGSATSKLSDDLHASAQDLGEAADKVSNTADTLSAAQDTIAHAQDTLKSVGTTTDSLSGTLSSSLGSLGESRKQAASLSSDLLGALTNGATTVSGISAEANYNVGALAGQVGWATGKINAAANELTGANQTLLSLRDSLQKTRDAVASLNFVLPALTQQQQRILQDLDSRIAKLNNLYQSQQSKIDALAQSAQDLNQTSSDVAGLTDSLNTSIKNTADALAGVQTDFATNTQPQIASALDSFAEVGGQVSGTLSTLSPMLNQTSATLDQLSAMLDSAKTSIATTHDQLADAQANIDRIADDIATLQTAEYMQALQNVVDLKPEAAKEFFTAPATLKDEPIFPVANYGSGVTPFYTNLALWVGGFVLVAIFKLEVDKNEEVPDFKPWQGYLGRGALLVILAELQALICTIGDIALGIQCLSPVTFVLAGMWIAFVYVNFIYALSIAFKHIGKALGVLLVVLQIPGSAGTYPIEMMPGFFQALHPWLPFTYGINAMRESIAGFYGNAYAWNLFMLSFLFVASLLIGITARRWLLNINALFDRRLGETEMMVTERYNMEEAHFRLSTIIKALMNSERYHETFMERAAAFELRYPVLIARAILALVVVPLVLLVLMLVLPYKMVLLTLWIVSIVAICTFMIVVEYFHNRVGEKTALANKSPEELYDLMGDELKRELLAFAPIERMRLDPEGAHDIVAALKRARELRAEKNHDPEDLSPKGGERS